MNFFKVKEKSKSITQAPYEENAIEDLTNEIVVEEQKKNEFVIIKDNLNKKEEENFDQNWYIDFYQI